MNTDRQKKTNIPPFPLLSLPILTTLHPSLLPTRVAQIYVRTIDHLEPSKEKQNKRQSIPLPRPSLLFTRLPPSGRSYPHSKPSSTLPLETTKQTEGIGGAGMPYNPLWQKGWSIAAHHQPLVHLSSSPTPTHPSIIHHASIHPSPAAPRKSFVASTSSNNSSSKKKKPTRKKTGRPIPDRRRVGNKN